MSHAKTERRLAALELERRAWTLYTDHGFTQAQIAAELHVTQGAVSKALARAETKAATELRAKVTQHKSRQLARLEAGARMALAAYHASIGEQTVKTSTHKQGQNGLEVTTRVQVLRKAGDSRFLAEYRGFLADMRKLLGLDAPTKIQQIDPERPDEGVSEAELKRELAAIYQQAGLSGEGSTH